MGEGPAVELCECDTQIRPLHHGQISCITTVQHIHNLHLIKDFLQHRPIQSEVVNEATSQGENSSWQEEQYKWNEEYRHIYWTKCSLLARSRDLWTNKYHQFLRCIVVTKRFAENHCTSSVVVVGSQGHKSLICGREQFYSLKFFKMLQKN